MKRRKTLISLSLAITMLMCVCTTGWAETTPVEEPAAAEPILEEVQIEEIAPSEETAPIVQDEEIVVVVEGDSLQDAYEATCQAVEEAGGEVTMTYEEFEAGYESFDGSLEEYATSVASSSISGKWYDDIGTTTVIIPQSANYGLFNLLSQVQKGDIICESAGLVAEYTGHIAIVEGTFWDSTHHLFYIRTIEANMHGVVRGVLDDSRFSYRGIQVYRVTNATKAQKNGAVRFCSQQLGKDYNWDGLKKEIEYCQSSTNSNAWYCSEMVWAAYNSQGINLYGTGTPRNIYMPEDLAASPKLTRISISTTQPASRFADISGVSWAKPAITYLANNGLMAGTGTTTFSPNSPMTRGMLMTILHKMEGNPSPSYLYSGYFSDVQDSSAYYYDAVNWAKENGLAAGNGDGTFSPNKSITREEYATFMYTYAKYKGYSLTAPNSSIAIFSDRSSISDWALTPMRWAVYHGILAGTSDTTLSPTATCTRAQGATSIYKFIDVLM